MKEILLKLIKFYQFVFSSYNRGCCRFTPTCSCYAYEAIKKFGIFKGGILFIIRFAKCMPFCKRFGYDPVPEKFEINIFNLKNKNKRS